MNKEIGFWLWKVNFKELLESYSKICVYNFRDEEYEKIIELIRHTNDELNNWVNYSIAGELDNLDFRFAYDGEEKFDMIHIRIQGSEHIIKKINDFNTK